MFTHLPGTLLSGKRRARGVLPPFVASVQYVTVTIAAGATSNTATISSVDTARTFWILNDHTANNTSIDLKTQLPRVSLTDATTLTVTRDTSHVTNTVTAYICVIECWPSMVKSVQSGTIAIGSGDTSVAQNVSAVNVNYSALFWNGYTTAGGGIANANYMRSVLTNSTTITINKNTSGNAGVFAYCLVEFEPDVIESIQQVSITSTAASSTMDATISAVTLANCLCSYNGHTSAVGAVNWTQTQFRGYLNDTTTFRADRNDAASTVSRTFNATVIQFKGLAVTSRQAQQLTLASGVSTLDTAVSAVDTNKAILSQCGRRSNISGGGNPDRVYVGANLTSTTNVRNVRATSTTNTAGVAWELMELK
jgi:hypothetical protein